MSNLNKIDSQISKFNFSNLRNTVPFGKSPFNGKINKLKYVVTNLYQIFCDLPIFKCSTLNNVPLLHPLKTSSFLKFSGVIEVEHWLKWVKYMIYILLVIDQTFYKHSFYRFSFSLLLLLLLFAFTIVKYLFASYYFSPSFVRVQPIKCQCCPHIETSQLICYANQLMVSI